MVNYIFLTQHIMLMRSPVTAGKTFLLESAQRAGAAQTPAQQQVGCPQQASPLALSTTESCSEP